MCDVNETIDSTCLLQSDLLSIDMSIIHVDVHKGRNELYGGLQCTPIVYIHLLTVFDTAIVSDMLPSFRKLEKIWLCGTYSGKCALKLPAFLHFICLDEYYCSSEWLCSLLIVLSALGHHVKCEMWSCVVQSCREDFGADSTIHLSGLRSKLLSCDMSNIKILVKDGSKDLFEIFRDTSIRILTLVTCLK
ncbi:hypothetical protein DPMN_172191 [Dreissena polymorpha]|uniref:Uncharacterized protein n=1 Tax=Dreissena polymorpha TaxID=45954 RepID=A0A9D4E147_DREPO|nr:hypothetical protein DPMN_172191 [Dreissena polymorpha]